MIMAHLLDAEDHASSDFFSNKIGKGVFTNVEHKFFNGFSSGLLFKNGYNEMQISESLRHHILIKSVKRFMGCMKISIYGLQKLNVIMDHYG
jgi:hypothetical protein